MTFPEPETKCDGRVSWWGVLFMCFWIGMLAYVFGGGSGAVARTTWIRADLATQGCVLVLGDAGEGQTWRVVCEGEGR